MAALLGYGPAPEAEARKARPNRLPSFFNKCLRRFRPPCGNLLHGVAFLSGFGTPGLGVQGRRRRSISFNIPPDILDK